MCDDKKTVVSVLYVTASGAGDREEVVQDFVTAVDSIEAFLAANDDAAAVSVVEKATYKGQQALIRTYSEFIPEKLEQLRENLILGPFVNRN